MLAFMRYAYFTFLLSITTSVTTASDWLTLPSTYSHDVVTGQRVSQFAPIDLPTATTVQNFRTSGYTHTRSQLNFGGSNDNYHRVETWGDPVRPYGEWQRPFRPGSVPYDLWGPPFGGLHWGRGGFGPGGFGPGGFGPGGFGPGGFGPGGFGGGHGNKGGHGHGQGGHGQGGHGQGGHGQGGHGQGGNGQGGNGQGGNGQGGNGYQGNHG